MRHKSKEVARFCNGAGRRRGKEVGKRLVPKWEKRTLVARALPAAWLGADAARKGLGRDSGFEHSSWTTFGEASDE